jgi:hypothetical protein
MNITAIATLVVALTAFETFSVVTQTTDVKSNAESVSAQIRRDSMTIDLAPAQRIEVKLVMKKGQKASYEWTSQGGEVTYNLHGEGPSAPGGKAHVYKRGSALSDKGEVTAEFDGVHGWSWCNATEKPVKIKVTANGQFEQLKKM